VRRVGSLLSRSRGRGARNPPVALSARRRGTDGSQTRPPRRQSSANPSLLVGLFADFRDLKTVFRARFDRSGCNEIKCLGNFYISTRARGVSLITRYKFKARIREMTRRTRGNSLPQVIADLAPYLLGWRGYFGFCQTPRVLTNLEAWIRRRLRAYLWRQWQNGPNRFKELASVACRSSTRRLLPAPAKVP